MLAINTLKVKLAVGLIKREIDFGFLALAIATLLAVAVIIAAPEARAENSNSTNSTNTAITNKSTITITGGKPIVTITNPSTTRAGPSYNKTGFTSLNVLTINGKNFPIKYSIRGGKLVGMLADKDTTTLVLVLNPGRIGGNITIELPRNVIDSKGASNADTKYQVKIDGKAVDYKELANSVNGRVLYFNFSKDNRFMEIIGTQMMP